MNSMLDRRNFLRLSSAFALMLARGAVAQDAPTGGRFHVKNRKNFVGIQVRGFSWVDEGVSVKLQAVSRARRRHSARLPEGAGCVGSRA